MKTVTSKIKLNAPKIKQLDRAAITQKSFSFPVVQGSYQFPLAFGFSSFEKLYSGPKEY